MLVAEVEAVHVLLIRRNMSNKYDEMLTGLSLDLLISHLIIKTTQILC